ncbi:translation initiation factor IF-2-like [Schistocerca serialis cubense]|uniref:translation initiation factor IF-2-like n=1 Tax=Schistocerca serialis cubense TaxID=2023355 RepID=UPI00214E4CD0|nr:translation initiation factor IF-2-like [Schistocerca serialis cubense]
MAPEANNGSIRSPPNWHRLLALKGADLRPPGVTGGAGTQPAAQHGKRAGWHRTPLCTHSANLVRGGFQPRLPTSLPPPGQQQQPSPLPRRQPVPLMPPAQLHPGAHQVVTPAPAVPLQSPPPSELMDVDPSAGPPSQAVAVQPVLQPLSLGTPKESDTAAPCPAPTQQPSTKRQETLPLFVDPDAPFPFHCIRVPVALQVTRPVPSLSVARVRPQRPPLLGALFSYRAVGGGAGGGGQYGDYAPPPPGLCTGRRRALR